MTTIQPRESLLNLSPYIPGKSIASVKREFGLKKVIKLASNENPLGPSPKAMAAYIKLAGDCFLYPEGSSPQLRQALACFHKVPVESILVGNGSDEIIRLLCEVFLDPKDEALTSHYAFLRFRQQALMMGANLIEIPMKNWKYDLKAIGQALNARTKLVFIANPNNPTGTYNSKKEIAAFIKLLPPSAILILDEAYCNYACLESDYPTSVPDFVPHLPNVIVLRTFSKAYGLAGLRVGYAIGNPEIIGWLDRIRMPFNVSLPAQQCCIEALKDGAFVRKGVFLAVKQRRFLEQALVKFNFSIVKSAANFVFAESPIPGQELFNKLLKLGVIIRPLDEYGLFRHVRISVGRHVENQILLSALRECLR
jgi:histidinol-phosphate aminotransferase